MGAMTGAIPFIALIIAIYFASFLLVNISVGIDFDKTTPPAPAIP